MSFKQWTHALQPISGQAVHQRTQQHDHFCLLCLNIILGRVQTATPNLCAVTKLDMDQVRAHLGISSGGHQALVAMALLMGGDYFMRGAERIGPKQVRRPAAQQA